MIKDLTVGKKIILGFSAVLFLLVFVGVVAFYGLTTASNGFTDYREMARDANLSGRLQANMLMVRMNVKNYLITGSKHDLEQFEDYWEKMNGFLSEAQKEIQDPERAAKIDAVEAALGQYDSGFNQVIKYMNQRNKDVNEVLNIKGPLMENTLTDIMISAEKDEDMTAAFYTGLAMKHLLLARLYMAKFLDTNDQKAVDRVHEEFGKMQKQLDILDKELQNTDRRRMLATVANAKNVYTAAFNDLTSVIFERNEVIKGTLDRIGPMIAKNVEDVKLDIKAVQDKLGPQLVASNQRTVLVMCSVGIFSLLVGGFLMFIITRSITKPLNRVIEGLTESSEQVASASDQVSSSSQELSEGSTQQASGIEETSSSLEEISSMTKQNAGNAQQADNLMRETSQVVSQANTAMKDLIESMAAISNASEETSKIIKTIDEIAFQTNLLALNAAVEAARAGEAGTGFAVVADEVRNLALRAAEAAKNTANLIEGTVKKVDDGSKLVTTTNEAFTQVEESTGRAGELVGEIAAASNEQSQGIEQINQAVTEMDKVVQQNASNAEESAAASEEMNAQAFQMKKFVEELSTLVGGNGSKVEKNQSSVVSKRLQPRQKKVVVHELVAHKADEITPNQVIPLDEASLADF